MRIGLWKPLLRPGFLNNPFKAQYLGFETIIAYMKQVAPQHEIVVGTVEGMNLAGMSCVSETFHLVKAACKGLRRSGFAGPIILGGPHITALPETLPFEADCCVVGPGEQTFKELVAEYEKTRNPDLSQIAGVAYRDSNGVMQQTQRRVPLPMDDLPVNVEVLPNEWMQLATIRGCPYRCEHCVEHTNQGKLRWLSAEKLVWIMEERMRITGNPNFFFQDDTFLAAPGRLKKIHETMTQKDILRKAKIHLISMNANLVKADTIPMLKDIGAVTIGMGAESWSPRVIQAMKRGVVTQADLLRVLDYAKIAEMLPVGGSLAFGFPGETRAEMEESISNARKMQESGAFQVWGCFVIQPLPGSRLWDRFLTQGRVSAGMDFSTLRIDADMRHFGTPWAYWNEEEIKREDFVKMALASGFVRKGTFV